MHGCFLSSALVVSGLQEAKGKAGRSSKAKGAKKTPSHVDNAFAFLAGACEVGELGPAGGDAWHFSLAKPKRKPEQDDASEDDGEEAWEARPHDRRTEGPKTENHPEQKRVCLQTYVRTCNVLLCLLVRLYVNVCFVILHSSRRQTACGGCKIGRVCSRFYSCFLFSPQVSLEVLSDHLA